MPRARAHDCASRRACVVRAATRVRGLTFERYTCCSPTSAPKPYVKLQHDGKGALGGPQVGRAPLKSSPCAPPPVVKAKKARLLETAPPLPSEPSECRTPYRPVRPGMHAQAQIHKDKRNRWYAAGMHAHRV